MKEVKKMNYYNGLFLKADDFITDQNYNINSRRLMNWNLNKVYGILKGLRVEPVLSSKKYTVTSGIAFSRIEKEDEKDQEYGAEIVLTSDHVVDFSEKGPGDYYITIRYNETKVDKDNTKGEQEIHWIERPEIEVKPAGTGTPDTPDMDIVLAKITVPQGSWESNVQNVDMKIIYRKEIGPAIRTINDNVEIGVGAQPAKVKVNGTVEATKFVGDGSGLTGIAASARSQWSDIPGGISYNAGNVGIGTTDPYKDNKLQVDGNLHMNGNPIYLRKNPDDKFDFIKWDESTDQVHIGGFRGVSLCHTGGGAIPDHTPALSVIRTGIVGSRESKLEVRVQGDIRINDKDIWLRGTTDKNHGIGWYGAGKLFANVNLDGPAVFGFSGGALGTTNNGQKIALKWDSNGNVEVSGNVTVEGRIIQEDWQTPSLLNNWINYSAEYNPAGYFLDKNGIVHLRGLVKNGVIGQKIFTLPPGYWPPYRELHTVTSIDAVARCDITADGDVYAMNGNNKWFSLDGITFMRAGVKVNFIKPDIVIEKPKLPHVVIEEPIEPITDGPIVKKPDIKVPIKDYIDDNPVVKEPAVKEPVVKDTIVADSIDKGSIVKGSIKKPFNLINKETLDK